MDAAANVVHLSLADAPQSIIDQLHARHPGIYVITNYAAHPRSELIRLQHALPVGPLHTASGSVNIHMAYRR